MTSTSTRYVGWHRASNSHPWKELVAGLTEADAWDLLFDHAPAGGDKTVLKEGTNPNTDRLPVRRRQL